MLLIAKDIYFNFRHTYSFGGSLNSLLVVKALNNQTTVVVYYCGSCSYGFGGDSCRPKNSVVRIYNLAYPQGKNIAQFGLKAGIITDITLVDNKLILKGDSTQPNDSKQKRKK